MCIDFGTDLPTHPLFSGDTRILQGSPAHPCRIASHPNLARLYERCTKRRSFSLIQSATGSRRRGNTVQLKTLEGENLANLRKIRFSRRKLARNACFCRAKDTTPPTFAGKNFAKSHKTTNLRVSRLPRLKFSIYMLFARVPVSQEILSRRQNFLGNIVAGLRNATQFPRKSCRAEYKAPAKELSSVMLPFWQDFLYGNAEHCA